MKRNWFMFGLGLMMFVTELLMLLPSRLFIDSFITAGMQAIILVLLAFAGLLVLFLVACDRRYLQAIGYFVGCTAASFICILALYTNPSQVTFGVVVAIGLASLFFGFGVAGGLLLMINSKATFRQKTLGVTA